MLAYEFVQLVGLDPVDWEAVWPGAVTGAMGHPVRLGGVLAMLLPYWLDGALDGDERRRSRLILGTLTAVGFLGVVLTHSRASMLAACSARCP